MTDNPRIKNLTDWKKHDNEIIRIPWNISEAANKNI